MDIQKWLGVKLNLNGLEIPGTKGVTYDSINSSFIPTDVLVDTTFEINKKDVESLNKLLRTIPTEVQTKIDTLRLIKNVGITLIYGMGEYPIGYSNDGHATIEIITDFEAFIKTVLREEWEQVISY